MLTNIEAGGRLGALPLHRIYKGVIYQDRNSIAHIEHP
jgi:hypothetical protein